MEVTKENVIARMSYHLGEADLSIVGRVYQQLENHFPSVIEELKQAMVIEDRKELWELTNA